MHSVTGMDFTSRTRRCAACNLRWEICGNSRDGAMQRTQDRDARRAGWRRAGRDELDGVRYLVTARAATVAAATASALTVLSLVDLEGPAVEVAPIERLHGAGGIGVGHLHEAETARTTGFAIGYQGDLFDGSVLGEERTDRIIG